MQRLQQIVDEDIKNNVLQQSVLDAIRNFNIQIENAMHGKY